LKASFLGASVDVHLGKVLADSLALGCDCRSHLAFKKQRAGVVRRDFVRLVALR
jgi:hypothetical protein